MEKRLTFWIQPILIIYSFVFFLFVLVFTNGKTYLDTISYSYAGETTSDYAHDDYNGNNSFYAITLIVRGIRVRTRMVSSTTSSIAASVVVIPASA